MKDDLDVWAAELVDEIMPSDPKSLLLRLKVVRNKWEALEKAGGAENAPEDLVVTLLLLGGVIAAKIAPAIDMDAGDLATKIKAEGMDLTSLVTLIEERLGCLKKSE